MVCECLRAVLRARSTTVYIYSLPDDIEYDTFFADVLVQIPLEAMQKRGRSVTDMENMFDTRQPQQVVGTPAAN